MQNSETSIPYSFTSSSNNLRQGSFQISHSFEKVNPLDFGSRQMSVVGRMESVVSNQFMGNNLEMVCLLQGVEIERLTENLRELEQKFNKMITSDLDRQSYETQIHELTEHIHRSQLASSHQINQLQGKEKEYVQIFEKQRGNMQKDYAQLEAKYQRSIQMMKDQQEQKEKMEQQIRQLEKKVYEVNVVKQELQFSRKIEVEQLRFEAESSRYDTMNEKLDQIQRLKDSIIVLRKEKEQYRNHNNQLAWKLTELKSLEETNIEYQNKLVLLSHEVERLNRMNKEKNEEINKLQKITEEFKEENLHNEHQIKKLQREISELKLLIQQSQHSKQHHYLQKLEESSRERKRLQLINQQLQANITQLSKEKIEKDHQLIDFRGKLDSLESVMHSRERQSMQIEDRMREKIIETQSRHHKYEAIISDLNVQLEYGNQIKMHQEDEIRGMKEKISSFISQHEELINRIEQFEKIVKEESQKYRQKNQAFLKIENQLEKYKNMAQKSEMDASQQKNEVNRLYSQQSLLRNQLQQNSKHWGKIVRDLEYKLETEEKKVKNLAQKVRTSEVHQKNLQTTLLQQQQQIRKISDQKQQDSSQLQKIINGYEQKMNQLMKENQQERIQTKQSSEELKHIQYELERDIQILKAKQKELTFEKQDVIQQINSNKLRFEREINEMGQELQAKNKRLYQLENEMIEREEQYRREIDKINQKFHQEKLKEKKYEGDLGQLKNKIEQMVKSGMMKDKQYEQVFSKLKERDQEIKQYQNKQITYMENLSTIKSSYEVEKRQLQQIIFTERNRSNQLQLLSVQKQEKIQQISIQLQKVERIVIESESHFQQQIGNERKTVRQYQIAIEKIKQEQKRIEQQNNHIKIKNQKLSLNRQTQIKEKEMEVEAMKKQLHLKNGEMLKVKQQKEQWKKKNQLEQRKINKLLKQIEAKEKIINNLTEKWEILIPKLQQAQKQHKTIIQSLQLILAQQGRQSSQLNGISHIQRLLETMKQQNSTAHHTLISNSNALNKKILQQNKQAEINFFRIRCNESEIQCKKLQQQIRKNNESYSKEAQELRTVCEKLEKQKNDIQNSLEQLVDAYTRQLEAKKKQLQVEFKTILDDHTKVQNELNITKESVGKLENSLERSYIEKQEMRKQYQIIMGNLEKKDKQLEKKEKQIYELSSIAIGKRYDGKLNQSNSSNNRTQTSQSGTRHKIEEYENKIELISQQLQRLQSILEYKNNQLTIAQEKIGLLQKQNSKKEALQMKQKNKLLTMELDEMKQKEKRSQQQFDKMVSTIRDMEIKLQRYRKSHEGKQNERVTYEEKSEIKLLFKQLKEENMSLKSKNYELTLELKKKQYQKNKIDPLNREIDRLSSINLDLEYEVKHCRMYIGDEATIDQKLKQTLAIIVLQSIEIESLRDRLKDSEKSVEKIRKQKLSPYRK